MSETSDSTTSTELPPIPACSCYGVAVTSVCLTLFILLLLEAVLYALYKIYWRGKKGQHLVLSTDSEKGDLYAYDNPGFKEGPSLVAVVKDQAPIKNKWALWSGGLVANGNLKLKSMDDSFSSGPVVRVVPLRSRDFTGLGFNICGNMRDGIFIKDVLHRGPAHDSGHISPGDRVESVKVSLSHVVLEDALTILSYASPYDLELTVSTPLSPSAPASASASASANTLKHPSNDRSIAHPFYKSHSISDLHRMEKRESGRGESERSRQDKSWRGGDTIDCEISTPGQKRSKQETERLENTKNCIIETAQKQDNIFHTIDLETETRSRESANSSPVNVKAILVKGIQNLKEKLHSSLHQEHAEERSPVSVRPLQSCMSEDVTLIEDADVATTASSTAEVEPEVERKRKGKAPTPPGAETAPQTDPSEDAESLERADSDNDTVRSGRIELDSSHVTVHRADNEGRKASSLGDLSHYRADRLAVLERAVSLDLADGSAASRKRKAPRPPRELSTYTEVETPTTGTLKKSDIWGTLEDAIKTPFSRSTPRDDSASDDTSAPIESGAEGSQPAEERACSTPVPSSSPIGTVTLEASTVTTLSSWPVTTDASSVMFDVCPDETTVPSPHLSFEYPVSSPTHSLPEHVNGNEAYVPPLPTSPVPDFITEIEIFSQPLDHTQPDTVTTSDNDTFLSLNTLQSFYLSPATDVLGTKSVLTEPLLVNGSPPTESTPLELPDSREPPPLSPTDDSERPRPPKRLKCFTASPDPLPSTEKLSSSSDSVKNILDFSLDEPFRIRPIHPPDDRPSASFTTFKTPIKRDPPARSGLASKVLRTELADKKLSIVEIESGSPPPSVSPPLGDPTKPPRSAPGTSRIPVRAGQRSPAASKHSPELRRLSDHRNGHHTSRLD